MAASSGGKNFLLDKGEKVGLGVAAVLGVLLIAIGLMSLGGAQSPEDFVKGVDGKAVGLTNKMAAKGEATIDVVPKQIVEQVDNAPLALNETNRTNRPYYDPTVPPDGLRITPIVLSVIDGQADMAILKILANDFVFERDASTGEVTKVRVGVVTAKEDTKIEGASDFLNKMKERFKGKMPRQRNPNPGDSVPGGPPGPGGAGFGGGPPPGGGAGAGGSLGPKPGGGGPPPGPGGGSSLGPKPGGGFGGMGGIYSGADTAAKREKIAYIEGENDEEIEKQLNGRRLAITIKPQRMNVLQASFPYAEQLKRYQQALRYSKLDELLAHPEDMPVFNGVDVQRKLYRPLRKGSSEPGELVEDWTSLDLAANSQELRAVKLYYDEDPVDLKRVELHEDHLLNMPLPHAIAGKYPDMKLKTIKESIDKMKKQDAKAASLPPPKSKFMGDANPFKRDSAPDAKFYNSGPGGFMPQTGGKNKPADPGNTNTNSQPLPPDNIYVRAYDTDVRDGLIHEYRMRVKLKNPNYGKRDLVSKKSDADPEELPPLEEHWFVFSHKVSVPQGGYTYVVEPNTTGKVAYELKTPREGQAVLQFQRWYEYVDVSEGVREPVGDWVIAEMLATRGMFVSGKAFSPLPFWDSVENAFVLREIPGDKAVKGKEPRRGVILEPVRPKSLLVVDVAGGKETRRIGPNPGEGRVNRQPSSTDECAAEVLFMYPDGSLDLHSSAVDKADADRKAREDTFNTWVKDTAEKNPAAPPKKGKEDFP
jgi:hypothetical protein